MYISSMFPFMSKTHHSDQHMCTTSCTANMIADIGNRGNPYERHQGMANTIVQSIYRTLLVSMSSPAKFVYPTCLNQVEKLNSSS